MDEQELLAEQFELNRPHLRAVAYRMLGSTGEAEDAVQESWFRLSRTDSGELENLRAWLTTVVGRICLDTLRARQARPEDSVDTVPEPLVRLAAEDPAQEAELADSVGLALLVVLETLSPAERLAFVLHDMFGVSFEEIAPIVERSPIAARQLASRARRRVRGSVPPTDADLAQQRKVVDAFLAAARAGDFEALLQVLDPDAVFRMHTGPSGPPALPPAVGAAAVAERTLTRGAPFAPLAQPAIVNGGAGVLVAPGGRNVGVAGFTISRGRIVAIDLIVDPERLRKLEIHA
ncbi:MAG: sigma-70 family RNA polymerase sigma factor [Actinobacteria bacterium]|nr:MAG: sigma-70 family RNA polymerase sigma factor [Actinomycetota bacterium]